MSTITTYIVRLDGEQQGFELPADIAADDRVLKDSLVESVPNILDAQVVRTAKDTIQYIDVTTQSGPKGNLQPVIRVLQEAPRYTNPAILWAMKLQKPGGELATLDQRLARQSHIRRAIDAAEKEGKYLTAARNSLAESNGGDALRLVIAGF